MNIWEGLKLSGQRIVWVMILLIALATMSAAQNPEEMKMVKVEEIYEKIDNSQPVQYNHVIIIGDLNLTKLYLPIDQNGNKIVASSIQIKNSVFEANLDFEDSVFLESIDFEGSTFRENAQFSGAQVDGSATFENVQFEKDASFYKSKFKNTANFNTVEFGGDVTFHDVEFDDDARFYESNFQGDATFDGSNFNGKAYFDGAQFNSYVNFGEVLFGKDVSFYQTKFDWNANFSSAKFGGMSYFEGAYFAKNANFENAEFDRYVNFNSVRFEEDAVFKGTQFNRDSYFTGTEFGGNLNLDNAHFSALQIEWAAIKDHLLYNDATYVALIKDYEGLGSFKDADDSYYQYRNENQARETSLGPKLMDILAWLTCGYGVRPLHTVGFSIFVCLIFAIFYWASGVVSKCKCALSSLEEFQSSPLVNSIYFSVMAFITPHASVEWRPSGNWKFVVLLEHILGWMIMALFLVTLGKVMIR